MKAGVRRQVREFINIGPKTTTARGKGYLTLDEFERQRAAGLLTILDEEREPSGGLKRVFIESEKWVESDTAVINRVLGRDIGGKQNILVFNDEAHHAYRIRRAEPDANEEDVFGEEPEVEEFYKEATVWVEGLDRVHKLRGVNFCVDLSATPYYLGRAIAKVIYEWLAENRPPTGIPPANIEAFLNRDSRINTIRVDSKVVHETDSGEPKSDEAQWMRFTLDTVGKTEWPVDPQRKPIHPDGFEELATKRGAPLHPPGRSTRSGRGRGRPCRRP